MSKFINFFKGKVWWKTLQFTLFIVFFTMLPFFTEIISDILYNRNIDHFKEGQFFTYSISLLSSSLLAYLSLSSIKNTLNVGLNLFSIVLLFILAFLYAILIINTEKPNENAIVWFSIIFFIITLGQFYHSQYSLNSELPDIGNDRRNESDDIVDAIN